MKTRIIRMFLVAIVLFAPAFSLPVFAQEVAYVVNSYQRSLPSQPPYSTVMKLTHTDRWNYSTGS